ncbi:MAG TPA: DnaB-like helicase N-terminal domain-containing protein [Thermodesulfobacteriota bacterium]|nr:DnaB-like helicase N-terminal domain-containing protein [Thermodesulfobacteriota bacterium]
MPPERTIEQALSCCDQDSEVNVLGAIIQEGRLINEVQDLKPKDFYLQKHQEVFKVMLEMKKHSVPIDITTLLADIRDRGLEEKIGGSPYLTHLVETTPTTATIRYHAERIKDAANVRTAVKGLTQLVLNGKGKSEEIREGLEKLIMDLGPRSGSLFEFKTISWQELVGQEEPEIEFLIEDLLPAACLLILAGKPKLGKSL